MIDKFSVIEPKMLLIVSQENRVMVSLFSLKIYFVKLVGLYFF